MEEAGLETTDNSLAIDSKRNDIADHHQHSSTFGAVL
jgi:hypothetical protein